MEEEIQLKEFIDQALSNSSDDKTEEMDQLLLAIKERVAYLLEREPELLFSSLYRLDVSELKVKEIMQNRLGIDKISALSQVILDRQLARFKTKSQIPQAPIDGWQW